MGIAPSTLMDHHICEVDVNDIDKMGKVGEKWRVANIADDGLEKPDDMDLGVEASVSLPDHVAQELKAHTPVSGTPPSARRKRSDASDDNPSILHAIYE